MVLVIDKGHVGFKDLNYTNIPESDTFIQIENGIVHRKGSYLCKSVTSDKIETCITDKSINGFFGKYIFEGKYIILQGGNKVLTRGPYDPNINMYSAISTNMEKSNKRDYYLNILEFNDINIIEANLNSKYENNYLK